jgi:hypothetical protein
MPPPVEPQVDPPLAEPRREDRPRALRQVVASPRVTAPPEIPLPFEAALGTILYGPERRLAIIDGRIVQIGDQSTVRGRSTSRRQTCFFAIEQGRLRQLACLPLNQPGLALNLRGGCRSVTETHGAHRNHRPVEDLRDGIGVHLRSVNISIDSGNTSPS